MNDGELEFVRKRRAIDCAWSCRFVAGRGRGLGLTGEQQDECAEDDVDRERGDNYASDQAEQIEREVSVVFLSGGGACLHDVLHTVVHDCI